MFASNHLQCLSAGPSVVHCGSSLLPSQDRTLPDCCSEHVKYDMLLLTSRSVPDKKLNAPSHFTFRPCTSDGHKSVARRSNYHPRCRKRECDVDLIAWNRTAAGWGMHEVTIQDASQDGRVVLGRDLRIAAKAGLSRPPLDSTLTLRRAITYIVSVSCHTRIRSVIEKCSTRI